MFIMSDHPLKKLVVAAATMSEAQLVKTRREVRTMSIDSNLKELVTTVLDLFIDIGENSERRAEAAARCLSAIDEVDSGRYSGGGSSGSGDVAWGAIFVVVLVLAGIAAAVYYFVS